MKLIKFGFLAFIFIALFFFATSRTNAQEGQIWETLVGVGDPNQSSPNTGPAPECNNVEQRLRSDFGVVVRSGVAGWVNPRSGWSGSPVPENIGCDERTKIYSILNRLFRSSSFKRKFNTVNSWTIECYRNTGEPYMRGTVNSGVFDGVQLTNCLYLNSHAYAPFLVVHEIGHLFSGRTGGGSSRVPWTSLRSSDGGSCYNSSGYIKTYGTGGGGAVSESFAEAIALYVYGRDFDSIGEHITSFGGQCSATRTWYSNNIFSGFSY